MTEKSAFQQFLEEDWEFRLQADPLFATSTGDNRYNDRLPDISEAFLRGVPGRPARIRTTTCGNRHPAASPRTEGLDCEIYSRLLANEMGLLRFKAYRMPISKAGGFHIYFPGAVPADANGDGAGL